MIGKILISSSIRPTCYRYLCLKDCQRDLVDESGVIPSRHYHHHHHSYPCSYITRGMKNRPVVAAVLRQSHLHHNKKIKDSLQQLLNAQKLCTRVGTITNRWKAICIIWFIFWVPREKRTSMRSKPAIRFFPWRWGGSSTQARMPTYVSILRVPQMIRVWRATVEWNIDRGKPKNSEKHLSQCYSVHHKSHMYWPGREPGPPRWEAGD
jgi:hypothetical protein